MKLIINGKEKELENKKTLEEILKELKLQDKVMAIAVNMEVIKKEDWKNFIPKDGDKIEMLSFVGGG